MKFNIKTMLYALASLSALGLLFLLIFSYFLLSNLNNRLEQQDELARNMLIASTSLSSMGQAISYLRDIALTGNLESDKIASELIEEVNNNLEKIDTNFQGAQTNNNLAEQLGEIETVNSERAQIERLYGLGQKMAKAYLNQGKEAGNQIMYQKETGFETTSKGIMTNLENKASLIRDELEKNTSAMKTAGNTVKTFMIVFIIIIAVILVVITIYIASKITNSIFDMTETVTKISAGDYAARCQLTTGDELQVLGDAFDNLLDERVESLARVEQENEALNESIIAILTAASKIGEDRDLSVEVPVNEDVSGAVSDAINSMVFEMTSVLAQISGISSKVGVAATAVDNQASSVSDTAKQDRASIDSTLKQLQVASDSMGQIAKLANACNTIATVANESTQKGLDAVVSTSEEMSNIRSTIQETAKRIKQLGERSQEISGIVDIINNISERTHVLSLNASIQAASAGEAGRGFSVVADEVQRLAENSRTATAQISKLIQNIQVETSDTIATMDKAIGEVVNGSELAEMAGHQMLETQENTSKLAQAVKKIAANSQTHSELTVKLKNQAALVQRRSVVTEKELLAQKQETTKLADYATQLIESVNMFKLPE